MIHTHKATPPFISLKMHDALTFVNQANMMVKTKAVSYHPLKSKLAVSLRHFVLLTVYPKRYILLPQCNILYIAVR